MTGRRCFFTLDTGEELDHRLAHLVQVRAELLENLGGNTLTLADEAEEDVFGPDVVVPDLQRLTQR